MFKPQQYLFACTRSNKRSNWACKWDQEYITLNTIVDKACTYIYEYCASFTVRGVITIFWLARPPITMLLGIASSIKSQWRRGSSQTCHIRWRPIIGRLLPFEDVCQHLPPCIQRNHEHQTTANGEQNDRPKAFPTFSSIR